MPAKYEVLTLRKSSKSHASDPSKDFELKVRSGCLARGVCANRLAVGKTGIKLKSLILAQIERWRHALHMQVERERGATPE